MVFELDLFMILIPDSKMTLKVILFSSEFHNLPLQGSEGVGIQRVRHNAHGMRADGQVYALLRERQAGQHAPPPHEVFTDFTYVCIYRVLVHIRVLLCTEFYCNYCSTI